MQHFGLGFANVTSDDLVKHLKNKGYTDSQIIEAGLASHDDKYGTHDKFWNRVMFPIQDASQKVIGFGGRVMGDGKPKYLNSPETYSALTTPRIPGQGTLFSARDIWML